MKEKKFIGLDGLKYFWTKIEAKVIKIIEDEIAQIVANAPKDLDTLKEIADWISTHEDSASAMNTAILANKTAINGKADKSHTHTKSDITDFPTSLKNPNALTINGKTYDGSSAVNAGVQTVANGGTGVTSQADINKAFIGDLEVGDSNVTDSTEFVSSYASDNGFSDTNAINKPYKRKFSKVWNYIKGKADSIYAASSHTHTKSQITDFPTSLPANGGTATKATQDGNGNVITSTYVKKSGDTLTGPIVMQANQYTLETAQLDMKNSDIKGANAIWFDDHAEVGEGLKFPRSSGSNYDFMRLDDGKIKVAPNVTRNASTATESIVAYTSDIPTSLPANGGTADRANNGFNSSTTTDSTPGWGCLTSANGYSNGRTYGFANGGGIATAEKDTKSSLQVDGDLYVHEGLDKVVDENSLKDIMKPNYTTGRLPGGVYKTGQTVSVSASITTTRGNPVFISYSGDFNSVNHGSTVPWIEFELFVDGQIVQRTSIDNSVALESDNTPFAGNALAVLSAGSHTIRLAASLLGDASGQIQFQEQDNLVNLVAFEL